MRKNHLSGLLVMLCIPVLLVACGVGGGGSNPPVVLPTKATVTLSTTGTLPAGTKIYGIDLMVVLPTGVTAKASPSSANPAVMVTDSGVVTAIGAASGADSVLATYLTSSTTPTHQMEIYVTKSDGFTTGEFATVNCDITPGTYPAAADFSTPEFQAVDQNGAMISGLTLGFTAAIQ